MKLPSNYMKSSKTKNNNIFFDIETILKHDKLVNMIYGGRGIGKTYSSLNKAIINYYETGKGTIYLRRFRDELTDFGSILDKVIFNNDYKNIEYDNKKKEYIDTENKRTIIKAIPLSKSVIKKSNNYNNFNLIIFDEFIIDKSNYNYIPNEFIHFNNFIETVSRLREITDNEIVKTIMLSNSHSRINPYFIGYNIPLTEENPYIKNDLLVYHAETSQEFLEAKKSTRWGKFISNNTDMDKYIYDGTFDDNLQFIEKLPAKAKQLATLKYLKDTMGVYISKENNNIYISKKFNPQIKFFALTKKDATPDIKILNKDNQILKILQSFWGDGKLRFEELRQQQIIIDILKLI